MGGSASRRPLGSSPLEIHQRELLIVFSGHGRSGKSAIVQRLVKNSFSPDYRQHTSCCFSAKTFTFQGLPTISVHVRTGWCCGRCTTG